MTHFFNYKSEEIKIESEYSYLIDQMVDVMFLMMLRVEEEDMLKYLIQDGGVVGVEVVTVTD